jgi:flagellar hook protein FlgE
MSLYGMMNTGISGMNGQAQRLSSVADNIANANTTGYKRFEAMFSTLVVANSPTGHHSGGVSSHTRQLVSQQGLLQTTASTSDLAITGNGFFIVQDSSGTPQLTRAGSFIPDAQGRLVNASGMRLMGYSLENGIPAAVANDFAGLEAVKVDVNELIAVPSTDGTMIANLPADADAVTGSTAADNVAGSSYTSKSSFVAYNNLGSRVLFDAYFTKTADNSWEVAVYDQADASPGTSFPYASGPLTTVTLDFDPANGTVMAASPQSLGFTVPGGQPMDLDISKLKQLGADFAVSELQVNGNGPANIERVEFGADGMVFASYSDGSTRNLYRIPLATVVSPDQMGAASGNLLLATQLSSSAQIGFPGDSGTGQIVSGALERSTVDIAAELTDMIEAQRNYTANSKVFQTGSELTETVINLKR